MKKQAQSQQLASDAGIADSLIKYPALIFMDGQILFRWAEGDRIHLEPRSPQHVAVAVSAMTNKYAALQKQARKQSPQLPAIDSGWLSPGAMRLAQHQHRQLVVYAIPPEIRTLSVTLAGKQSKTRSITTPLPPAVLIGYGRDWKIFAMADLSITETLYHFPATNVFMDGGICWGNTLLAEPTAVGAAVNARAFFASNFTQHSFTDKSKAFPRNIMEQWKTLQARQALTYPLSDLEPFRITGHAANNVAPTLDEYVKQLLGLVPDSERWLRTTGIVDDLDEEADNND